MCYNEDFGNTLNSLVIQFTCLRDEMLPGQPLPKELQKEYGKIINYLQIEIENIWPWSASVVGCVSMSVFNNSPRLTPVVLIIKAIEKKFPCGTIKLLLTFS